LGNYILKIRTNISYKNETKITSNRIKFGSKQNTLITGKELFIHKSKVSEEIFDLAMKKQLRTVYIDNIVRRK